MPTIITHAVVAAVATRAFAGGRHDGPLTRAAVACSMLPDADVIAFSMGIPYEHVIGHRGLTHSLPFACLVGGLVAWFWFRARPRWRWHAAFLVLVTASHGLTDALTNGGLGIAFFAPFLEERYFFPATPILVSPIGVSRFLSDRGLAVLSSEMLWIWLPLAVSYIGLAPLVRSRPLPSHREP